jgi:phosphatidylglycerol:prolipoprotein diacylglycerol transferase
MHALIPFPDIAPEIFTIEIGTFAFSLRWYALAYIAGLLIGWRMMMALMRRPALWPAGKAPMAPVAVEGLLTWIILGVILGGRLGFVLFYQPGFYLSHPAEIVKLWQGGMSFHGGLIGVLVAILGFCRHHRIPAIQIGDAVAVATPVGLFLGRIANFINAELWGRPTTLPWGVIFPGQAAQDCGRGWVGACARHPSQLYEAGMEGLILGLVLWVLVWRGGLRRPGLMIGVFAAGYGTARFVVEFFRQADQQFITPDNPLGHVVQLGGFGLSMGQLLSLPMIVLGVGIAAMAWRRA